MQTFLIRCSKFVCLCLLMLPVASEAQKPAGTKGKATVYFYRLRDSSGAMLKPSVYLDGAQIARMRNGRFMLINVAPGEHKITSTFTGSGLEMELKAGQTYYFRVAMSHASLIHNARGEIQAAMPDQGKFEVAQLKPAEPEDLKVSASDVTSATPAPTSKK